MINQQLTPIIIILEGPNYVGKTFLANKMVEELKEHYQRDVCYFREPGTGEAPEKIRDIVVGHSDLEDYTQALLFTASRYEAFKKEIFPKLEQGSIVVMDRSVLSTLVYQSNIKQVLQMTYPLLDEPMYMGTNVIMCLLDTSTELIEKRRNIRGITKHFDTYDTDTLRKKYKGALVAINTAEIPIWDESSIINLTDDTDNNIAILKNHLIEQIDNIIKEAE